MLSGMIIYHIPGLYLTLILCFIQYYIDSMINGFRGTVQHTSVFVISFPCPERHRSAIGIEFS